MEDKCQRAAEAALISFRWIHGEDEDQTDIIDLIADMLLYADSIGEDAEAILRMATEHYTEEREG